MTDPDTHHLQLELQRLTTVLDAHERHLEHIIHTRPVGTVETSSPVAKGMGTRDHTRIGTRDELNRDKMKQSHLAASALTMCPECFGKYRTGYDDPDEEGLAHTYDPQTRLYRVCERCSGLGKVPK